MIESNGLALRCIKMIKKYQYGFEGRLWIIFYFKRRIYFKLCDATQISNRMQSGTQPHFAIYHHWLIELEIFNTVIDHHFYIVEFGDLIP